ncbi:MAG: hypothetical protein IIB26_07990 [Chloroflexi bacterium]|nr:hypothetical protein [Chloroflexota bacterium]
MTDQVARDGDIVDPMGMEVEHYLRNPVVMWAHDYVGHTSAAGLPIGRTLALSRSPRGIDVEFEFLPGDASAERVANAWDRGFLRTASIGWESLQTVPLPGRHGVPGTRQRGRNYAGKILNRILNQVQDDIKARCCRNQTRGASCPPGAGSL